MSRARIVTILVLAVAAAGAMIWALMPEPVPVDVAQARVAPMEVTVAGEGVARIREPWLVTAQLTGMAARSPVQVGDHVVRGETVVAEITPAEPAFLDARARRLAEATVAEAEAALRVAEQAVSTALTELDYAQTQLERNRELAARGAIPQRMLDDAERMSSVAAGQLVAAQSQYDMHRATLARAEAQLFGTGTRDPVLPPPEGAGDECCAPITAPHSGTVLSVENMSARLVQAGAPLLTIGDLDDLEIEVDLLSSDAVRIVPGARAWVERWGGEGQLDATVRRIDPAAFTRVSALGIEEQRVRVRLDFADGAETRPGLGDGYRVFVQIVVWEDDAVLQIPISALFRSDGAWAVYAIEDDLAVLTEVELGRRTRTEAQILGGLSEGAGIVAFPGERVQPGVRLVARDAR